jgi:hypothetical protein
LGRRAVGLVAVTLVMASLLVGAAKSAAGDSPGVKTSAHFVTFVVKYKTSCVGEYGIEFRKVHGATLYTLRYHETPPGGKTETAIFPDQDVAARMATYEGPRLPLPAGTEFFLLNGTICSADNPYARMESDPEVFAVKANP